MRSIAAINEKNGILVAYMTWAEQRAIENVGSTRISVRNIYRIIIAQITKNVSNTKDGQRNVRLSRRSSRVS